MALLCMLSSSSSFSFHFSLLVMAAAVVQVNRHRPALAELVNSWQLFEVT